MKRILALAALFAAASPLAAQPNQFREGLATIINLNRMLCAEVVSYRKLTMPDTYEVDCILYRGGAGRAIYVIDMKTGKATRQ